MQSSLLRVYGIIRFFVKGKMTISYKFACTVVAISPSSPSFILASYQLAYHSRLASLLNTLRGDTFHTRISRRKSFTHNLYLLQYLHSLRKTFEATVVSPIKICLQSSTAVLIGQCSNENIRPSNIGRSILANSCAYTPLPITRNDDGAGLRVISRDPSR